MQFLRHDSNKPTQTRRSKRVPEGSRALIVLALAAVLTSCGGGGSVQTAQTPIFAPQVVQVPTGGPITILQQTAGSVLLSGQQSFTPGQIIASDQGPGFLGEVVSVSQSGGNTLVSTSPAALTDAIQECDLSFHKDYSASELSVQPATISNGSAAAAITAATSPGGRTLAIQIPTTIISAVPLVTVSGELDLTLSLDAILSISRFKIQHFRIAPFCAVSTKNLVINAQSGTVSGAKLKTILRTITLPKVTLCKGVVLTPKFVLSMGNLAASLNNSLKWQPQCAISLTTGLDYTASQGWKTLHTITQSGGQSALPDPYIEGSIAFALFEGELDLLLDNQAGGWVDFDCPTLQLGFSTGSSGTTVKLESSATLSATIGIQQDFNVWSLSWGYQLLELVLASDELYSHTFPADGSVGVTVH